MAELGHVIHPRVFWKVFAVLVFLTIITVILSPRVSGHIVDFGKVNILIALSIATIKASLVLMYFMHLKFEGPWILVYFILPVSLLILMIAGVFIDNPLRIDPSPEVNLS